MKEVKIATRLINDENGKLSFSFSVNDIVDENGERIFKVGDDVIVQIRENTSLFVSSQKQDCLKWSEEDEYCIHQLILFCEKCMVQDSGAIRCTNWLKSLKGRVQPKQEWSEKDNNALKVITKVFEVNGVKLLHYPAFVHWLKTLPNRITPQNTWKPSDE